MRTSVMGVILLMAVQTASAAILYEFRQTTSSELEGTPATDCSGRAVIEGEKSRVEFVNCNAYPAGSFVLTTNGSRVLTFVDPAKKSFADVNAGAVATALGSTKIVISNRKTSTVEMPDHPVIAGMPTKHIRLSMEYDITVTFGNLPLTQSVQTIIDRWTTMAFGDIAEIFLSGGALRTGNADIDDLFAFENARGKGFPLKETMRTTTINNRAHAVKSQLAVSRMVTVTRDLEVSSVKQVAQVAANTFDVPAGFHRADPLKDDTQKAPIQTLSMEPSGQ
ncbi:MAG: hypothetical protein AABO58_14230 [Acidobacteriota bacterium]